MIFMVAPTTLFTKSFKLSQSCYHHSTFFPLYIHTFASLCPSFIHSLSPSHFIVLQSLNFFFFNFLSSKVDKKWLQSLQYCICIHGHAQKCTCTLTNQYFFTVCMQISNTHNDCASSLYILGFHVMTT